MKTVDLNADMGESFGAWHIGHDAELMPYVTSANIACGAHAGDPTVMASTVKLARDHGVSVGAHPGYADLQGFGRRAITLSPAEVTALVLYQLGALWGIARSHKVELHHVKPHGALYNTASSDKRLADSIAEAVWLFSPSITLMCLAGSQLEAAAHERGLPIAREGFADRAYEPTGLLAARNTPGAVLSSPQQAASQALALASGSVTAIDGTQLPLQVDTLCIHSDTPGAPAIARAVREALVREGFTLAPFRAYAR